MSHVLDIIYNRIATDLANAGQYGNGQDQFDFPCQITVKILYIALFDTFL
jgi:hypothetical protein